MFMHRHYLGQVIQYLDLTAERSPYVKYGKSHYFPLVGHLGLIFQNVHQLAIRDILHTLALLRSSHSLLRSNCG